MSGHARPAPAVIPPLADHALVQVDALALLVGAAVEYVKIERDRLLERRAGADLLAAIHTACDSAHDLRYPLTALRGWCCLGLVPPCRANTWRLSHPNGTLRVMTELPSGSVTFLFTDLESSTRLWEEHPDAMPAASGTPSAQGGAR
jgi:hypothetical protein